MANVRTKEILSLESSMTTRVEGMFKVSCALLLFVSLCLWTGRTSIGTVVTRSDGLWRRERRRLASPLSPMPFGDPRSIEPKAGQDTSELKLYDRSCPLLRPRDDRSIETGSNRVSADAGTLLAVEAALESGKLKNRKVILVGDSIMAQTYFSLGCLAHRTDAWIGHNGLTHLYRFTLAGNTDVVHSTFAGGPLLGYNSGFANGLRPDQTNGSSWIASCEARLPFAVEVPVGLAGKFVRGFFVTLTERDAIYVHATIHNEMRWQNVQNIVTLLKCMKTARAQGEDPGWPRVVVVSTLHQHFPNHEGGTFSLTGDRSCKSEIDPEADSYYQEEAEAFVGKFPVIGRDLGIERMGQFHIGWDERNRKLDCSHWSLPGVPDLIAKDIVNDLVSSG